MNEGTVLFGTHSEAHVEHELLKEGTDCLRIGLSFGRIWVMKSVCC